MPSNSQARARSGCQSCRVRHLKCDDRQPSCARCAKSGIECVRGYNIRFRHGANPSVDLKGGPQCDYDFSDNQTWLMTAPVLSFIDETQDLANIYDGEGQSPLVYRAISARGPSPPCSHASTPPVQPTTPPVRLRPEPSWNPAETITPRKAVSLNSYLQKESILPGKGAEFAMAKRRKLSGDMPDTFSRSSGCHSGPESTYLPSPTPIDFEYPSFSPNFNVANSPVPPPLVSLPDDQIGASNPFGFSDISSSIAGICQGKSIWPLSDYEEARLVRYFSQEVAPNLDMCDPQRHFELVVPARAATCPILHHAILAAAARQLSRIDDFDPYVSNRYHQECLSHLIPLLSDEAAILDENILAAGVILRYIEEIELRDCPSATDPDNSEGQHLFGTNLFMAAQERLTLTGGLCHAAYFVALRQEIHCAFAHQRTIAPVLSHANIDRSLGPADPATWANRIVVHNADVLRFCFDAHADRSTARFTALDSYTRAWAAAKPTSLNPLFVRPADKAAGRLFPETWLPSALAVCATQQLHLCTILLAAHDPRVPRLGPARRTALAAVDDALRTAVLAQCGVALANEHAHAAFVYASLGIGMCGERFCERRTQEALFAVLERTERDFAWPTGQARRALRAAWGW